MADTIISPLMGTFGFVKDVMDTWDAIERKRQDEKATEDVATALKTFGLKDKRDDLQLHLDISQAIIKDSTLSPERRKRLDRSFQSLFDILKSLPKAVDDVLAKQRTDSKGKHKLPRIATRHLWPRLPGTTRDDSVYEVLKAKVADFETQMAQFNTLVMSLQLMVNKKPEEPLSLSTDEFLLIGAASRLPGTSDSITTSEASHGRPGENETVTLNVIVETIKYQSESTGKALELGLRTMSGKLQGALPSEHIPRLLGYQRDEGYMAIHIVFYRPQPENQLVGLADIFAKKMPKPSLNLRLQLCRQLAVAVLQAHTLGLVHKQVRPENILLAVAKDKDKEDKQGALEDATLYLSGWNNSRIIVGTPTKRIGETAPQNVVYQHPDRHGGSVKSYTIFYDIYSLGVCMLELLTWDPLVLPGARSTDPPTLAASYRAMFEKRGYLHKDEASDDDDDDDSKGSSSVKQYTRNGAHVRETLIALANLHLPRKAGNRVMNVVGLCLDPREIVEAADNVQISDRFRVGILEELDAVLNVI